MNGKWNESENVSTEYGRGPKCLFSGYKVCCRIYTRSTTSLIGFYKGWSWCRGTTTREDWSWCSVLERGGEEAQVSRSARAPLMKTPPLPTPHPKTPSNADPNFFSRLRERFQNICIITFSK